VKTPGWIDFAVVAALYFAGAKLGMLTVVPEGMAVFWPANAVVLAALLRYRGARLPWFGAVVVAMEMAADVPAFSPVEALLFGVINFGEASLAFVALRHLRFDPAMPSLRELGKFVLGGPLLASSLSSFLGAAVYAAFRGGETGYLHFAHAWWAGDALGLLVATPLLLGFPPFRTLKADAAAALSRADAVVGVLAVVAAIGMWQQIAPLVLLVPFVLYAGLRHSLRWAAAAVAVSVLFSVVALANGVPFGPVAGKEAVVYVQRFMSVLALIGLGFCALVSELREQRAALERRVAERTKDLVRANVALERLAVMDPLSEVGNRRSFDRALLREAERAARYGRPLSLVFADLDHFKRVNDTFGHAAGDGVIRAFAQILATPARRSDLVARYGGEEFAVLMPETSAAQAAAFAERARLRIAELAGSRERGAVTASFGVAELRPGETGADLVEAADGALYEAKRGGRNRIAARGGLPEESRHSVAN
jgi:diguanylate cyclase (GGDEF)-like protein